MKRIVLGLAMLGVLGILAPGSARALSILLPVDETLPPLVLVRHEQEVEISGQVARTTIRQAFRNPTPRTLEAVYLFPLPRDAQVTDFSMVINGNRVHGEVLERDKARGIYEDIVRRLRDPGLIEYMDDNLLRVRVFPIPPRGDQEIELELSQVLPKEGGLTRYEFPFGSDPGRTGLPEDLAKARLSIAIKADSPLAALYSPSHRLRIQREKNGKRAAIDVEEKDLLSGRDFVLYYATSEKDIGVEAVGYRPERDEPGYFLLLVSPQREEKEEQVLPKDVTFVLDTSGSMAHDGKLEQAKDALIQCIGALRKGDRFAVVQFSTEVDVLSETYLPATADSREKAERFIEAFVPRGGTNIEGALQRALGFHSVENSETRESEGQRLQVVVFLTDGRPTVGQTVPKAILNDVESRNRAGLRIFPFGLGYDVNTRLLDDLAAATHATVDYVKPEEEIEPRVGAFFDKVSAPALTDVELEIEGIRVFDVYPKRLPDLFFGQQVVVFGRYREGGDALITLRGRMRDEGVKHVYEAGFPDVERDNGFIEPLWGARKIGFLLEEIRRNGETEELREEVVRLAKEYNVVTPYTSFLVTEDEAAGAPIVRHWPGTPERRDVGLSGSVLSRQRVPGSGPTPIPAPGMQVHDSALAFSQSTGETAVQESLALRDMKSAERLGEARVESRGPVRAVGGKTYVLRDGVWVDSGIDGKLDLPVVKIQFGSAAYFELVRIRPDLKPILELGDQVRVGLERAVLEIGPGGVTELGKRERELLKR